MDYVVQLMTNSERECCLLVLNLVSSTLPCIRQPGPRMDYVVQLMTNSILFKPPPNSILFKPPPRQKSVFPKDARNTSVFPSDARNTSVRAVY